MNERAEGLRLAKRVAALQGCSRREAEALINSGAVQVAGEVVIDPARRVSEDQAVQVNAGPMTGAITVLLHKPADLTATEALRQAWTALALGPLPPASLQECLPLPNQVSGLSVWSDERTVVRRLLDRQRPLETEWLLSLPLAGADAVIEALRAGGVRASLSHSREGQGQWRLVDKGDRGQGMAEFLDSGQFAGQWTLRRQRLGRQGLSPLSVGQARLRLDFEKF